MRAHACMVYGGQSRINSAGRRVPRIRYDHPVVHVRFTSYIYTHEKRDFYSSTAVAYLRIFFVQQVKFNIFAAYEYACIVRSRAILFKLRTK